MAKEGCKKKTIRFVKHAWGLLGPVLAPHVARMVALVNELAPQIPDLLDSGHKKRKFVLDSALSKAKLIGHDAYDDIKDATIAELKDAIRVQIARSVYLLEGATEGWEDTVDMSDEGDPVAV